MAYDPYSREAWKASGSPKGYSSWVRDQQLKAGATGGQLGGIKSPYGLDPNAIMAANPGMDAAPGFVPPSAPQGGMADILAAMGSQAGQVAASQSGMTQIPGANPPTQPGYGPTTGYTRAGAQPGDFQNAGRPNVNRPVPNNFTTMDMAYKPMPAFGGSQLQGESAQAAPAAPMQGAPAGYGTGGVPITPRPYGQINNAGDANYYAQQMGLPPELAAILQQIGAGNQQRDAQAGAGVSTGSRLASTGAAPNTGLGNSPVNPGSRPPSDLPPPGYGTGGAASGLPQDIVGYFQKLFPGISLGLDNPNIKVPLDVTMGPFGPLPNGQDLWDLPGYGAERAFGTALNALGSVMDRQGVRSQVGQGLLDSSLFQSQNSGANILNNQNMNAAMDLTAPGSLDALGAAMRTNARENVGAGLNNARNRLSDLGFGGQGAAGIDPALQAENLAANNQRQANFDITRFLEDQKQQRLATAGQAAAIGTDVYRALNTDPMLRIANQLLNQPENLATPAFIDMLTQIGSIAAGHDAAREGNNFFNSGGGQLLGNILGTIGNVLPIPGKKG